MLMQAMRYAVLRRRTCGGAQWQLLAMGVVLWVLGPIHTAQAVTIRVPQDQPTIQAAVSHVNSGTASDTVILLAPGTYTESVSVSVTRSFTLRGSEESGATVIVPTQAGPAIRLTSGAGASISIEHITFQSNPDAVRSFAIDCTVLAFSISHCRFMGFSSASTPSQVVKWSTFVAGSSARITDCEFASSAVESARQAQAICFYGGGTGAMVEIERCEFSGHAHHPGGAVSVNMPAATSRIADCLFEHNSGRSASISALGYCSVLNCTFVNNTLYPGNANVTFGVVGYPGSMTIQNSVFWGNTGNAHEILGYTGSQSVTVEHSLVQGTVSGGVQLGVGCFVADPRFVNAAAGDYRLMADSPCIDAGDNRVRGLNDAIDLRDEWRFVDRRSTPDTGFLAPGRGPRSRGVIDLGVHEYQESDPVCTADVDGTGRVTVEDLFAYLDRWFAQMGTACP